MDVDQGAPRRQSSCHVRFARDPRRLSTTGPRHPIRGPEGHPGTTPCLRDRLFTLARPVLRQSHSRTQRNPTPSCPSMTARLVASRTRLKMGLDTKRIRSGIPQTLADAALAVCRVASLKLRSVRGNFTETTERTSTSIHLTTLGTPRVSPFCRCPLSQGVNESELNGDSQGW